MNQILVTYAPESDQYNQSEFTIDASGIFEEKSEVVFPKNTYVIVDIVYNGKNEEIIRQGYGCYPSFYCKDGLENSFLIAVGDSQVERLGVEYGFGSILAKDKNHSG